MNVFDILGPIMVGPSSSHTAGAVRIGLMVRSLLGEVPKGAKLQLHGSFASTGQGHGTHQALIGGLLGFQPDDARVPDSFALAEQAGLEFDFSEINLRDAHPNSVLITAISPSGREIEVGACSPGGGRIRVFQLDGLDTSFTGELPTLVVHNSDQPGCVSRVTEVISRRGLNVATLQLSRGNRGGVAVMVIECDQILYASLAAEVEALEGILRVTCYNPNLNLDLNLDLKSSQEIKL